MKQDQEQESKLTRTALVAVTQLHGLNTLTEAAKYVPVQYFGVMVGTDAPDYKDGTFIVKRANLDAIKRYVQASLKESVDLSAIEQQLGYTRIGVAGLEPADFQQLNQRIREHALSWATLERDTKDLGARLDLFAKGFINTGRQVISHLKKFDGYQNLSGTIDTLSESELEKLKHIPLGDSDIEKVHKLDKYFNWMKKDIENFCYYIEAVKDLAVEFSRKITEDLLPTVNTKLSYVERAGVEVPAKINDIKARIKELDVRIAEKISEYDSLVGYAFAGLVFGPLGVAITGGIFGSQAETVRSQKNALIQDRSELLKEMVGANSSLLLSDLAGRLTNMKALMIDAEEGAKNLEDVWAIIWLNVVESADRLATANNALDLNLLVLDLQAVVEPWDVIRGHANNLSRVFNETVG